MNELSVLTDYFCSRNYIYLEPKKIIENDEVYFIMSPIAAHMDIFDLNINGFYFSDQKCFSSDKLDGTGKYPLATPYEYMSGFFRTKDKKLYSSIKEAISFLEEMINTEKHQLLFRSSSDEMLLEALSQNGILEKNIFVWKSLKPLYIGKNRPRGEYLYTYVRYNHGMVPVMTIGFIPHNGTYFIDSAFSIERCAMVREHVFSPPLTSWYKNSWSFISQSSLSFSIEQKYQLIYLMRSVIALMSEGVFPSHHFRGHILKKLLKLICYTLTDIPYIGKEFFFLFIKNTFIDIYGQVFYDEVCYQEISNEIYKYLQFYKKQSHIAIEKFKRLLLSNSPIDDLYRRGYEELGLSHEIIHQTLLEAGFQDIALSAFKPRFSLKNVGYPFDDSSEIDVDTLLKTSEEKYL